MGYAYFHPRDRYASIETSYQFLPFRFDRLENGDYFLTNEVGEYQVLSPAQFLAFTSHKARLEDSFYLDLKAKHFLADNQSSTHFQMLASKYRTKRSFLDGFTKLHIFVTSLRCNQSCPYCQVSRQGSDADKGVFDMSLEVLRRSIDLMFTSPAQHITMEFQGGEPLVNFDLVKEAVSIAESLNAETRKQIDYVICTNLSMLTDDHLEFCKNHNVLISTSLDGPELLHDSNRPMTGGKTSHAVVTKNIRRAQEALGVQAISALMTTTKNSLKYPKEIVDEYLRMNLGSLFVRDLNPFGFAAKTATSIGYDTAEFTEFYKAVLDYIIKINRSGRTFSEAYASMILTKILTPWPIGFVDLQSPSGAGIGVVLYNYDGNVYASDEARMLAEVGDYTFRLGNVLDDSYRDIFFGDTMQRIAAAACNESLAGCSDCAYQNYCGADPIRHYRTQGDFYGNRAGSTYCRKNMAIIKHLFSLILQADPDLERIFWAWINRDDVNHLKLTGDINGSEAHV
jgi:His-Xaa-Ser system radical SAM maturase HxsB